MRPSARLFCYNHGAGHSPHYFQAKAAHNKNWLGARVSYLGTSFFKLELEDGRIMFTQNHDPEQLLQSLDSFSGWPIKYQDNYHLLSFSTGSDSKRLFSMSTKPLDFCSLR